MYKINKIITKDQYIFKKRKKKNPIKYNFMSLYFIAKKKKKGINIVYDREVTQKIKSFYY